ncbi:MAG: hypothetical protein NVS4B4_16330 [Bradyrhizobium sp.]
MHRKASSALVLILTACGGMKDPASVADRFVDKYYVESDQDRALPLTTGVAAMHLRDELLLASEGRRGQSGMPLRQVRVYYTRKALKGEGAGREADYELDIRPQGGGDLQRLAEILGTLHYLRGICGSNEGPKWRNQMQALVDAETPSGERRARMIAGFNRGYNGFQQTYRSCTPAAAVAIRRYIEEGSKISRDLTARYAN